jgi:hypothetical protein
LRQERALNKSQAQFQFLWKLKLLLFITQIHHTIRQAEQKDFHPIRNANDPKAGSSNDLLESFSEIPSPPQPIHSGIRADFPTVWTYNSDRPLRETIFFYDLRFD